MMTVLNPGESASSHDFKTPSNAKVTIPLNTPNNALHTLNGLELDRTRKIFRPVVFQCRHCRSILSDSSDLASTDPHRRLISFRRSIHPNIVILPEWHLHQQGGFGFGSVYQALACRNCGEEIGLKYHTTNADTDHLRGMLTMRTEALVMYELQFDEGRVKKDIEEAFGANFGAEPVNTTTPSPDAEVEITKLQKFCLVLYDRIVRLEEQVLAFSALRGAN